MSNALLSDVEARAERRRTRTRDEFWQALVQHAWRRAQSAIDPAEARRWLERAHRMLPLDGMVAAALASRRLQDNEPAAAAVLFQALADRDGSPEAWTGLATCAHLLGDPPRARAALARALHGSVPTPTLCNLANAIAPGAWCGLTTDGVLVTGAVRQAAVRLDGAPISLGRNRALPDGWRSAALLDVDGPAGPMLGSPLPVPVFAGIEGFAEVVDGGLRGWAWRPADPGRDPVISIDGPLGRRVLTATIPAEGVDHGRRLARPRRFVLTPAEAAALGAPLSVRGPDGRHLLGSPLDPGLEARAAADPGHAGFAPVWADVVGPPPVPGRRRPRVDVVVPVYRGLAATMACLDSVLKALPRTSRLIVVEDASPDPALVAALIDLSRRRLIVLLRLPENRGFPGAANAGLDAADGRDVVLLNSDTLVPPGWLERLQDAAYGAPDIGAITPLTNDGAIVSYPDRVGGNAQPGLAETIALDRLAQRANGAATVDLPVGVGFCLFLRRDCLDQVGTLREDLFAQGYGEENDLCLRARHRGWRSVAAPGVFVAHAGATSFGAARGHLMARNGAILERLHPGYDALIARHVAADPLGPARQRMDALRWTAERRRRRSVVLITHAGGGGVDLVIDARARAAAGAGLRAIVLRPSGAGVRVTEHGGAAFPNLVFPMPDGLPALARLLRADRPHRVELHHLLGHHHAIAGLAGLLDAAPVSVVHDYARFCPRIALIGPERRYCGEPDLAGCEACIADQGSLLEDDPSVPLLLERSMAELSQASMVIVPSADAAARLRRHFAIAAPTVEPWEDDAALPALSPARQGRVRRIVVVGAIGVEKGYAVLLACARDARARALPLEFVVVGFTADDERLMDAGPVFVTGEYKEDDAIRLIQAQGAHLAFIPSIWPETWCFALSRAWQAGLPAAVFDIGAQAERTRRTGRGWPLPLGLPPRALNDALLRLAPGTLASQCPPQFPAH